MARICNDAWRMKARFHVVGLVERTTRSPSGLGSVGCESTAAVHFSPSLCPIAGLWGCKSGKNCPRRGRFSLSTPQVRQAPSGQVGVSTTEQYLRQYPKMGAPDTAARRMTIFLPIRGLSIGQSTPICYLDACGHQRADAPGATSPTPFKRLLHARRAQSQPVAVLPVAPTFQAPS